MSTEVKIGHLQTTVQVPLGRGPEAPTIAFVIDHSERQSKADLDAALDVAMAAAIRQRSKIELGEKALALQANPMVEAAAVAAVERDIKTQLEERARLQASFEAAREGRRQAGSLNQRERDQLNNMDRTLEGLKERREVTRREYARERDLLNAQMERLRALIDGREPPEPSPELAERLLPEAAD